MFAGRLVSVCIIVSFSVKLKIFTIHFGGESRWATKPIYFFTLVKLVILFTTFDFCEAWILLVDCRCPM